MSFQLDYHYINKHHKAPIQNKIFGFWSTFQHKQKIPRVLKVSGHFMEMPYTKINAQRQNQSAVSWKETFLEFYRFFRILQTWSALDWIWPHFCIISCLGIRKRFRLSGEMDWANTQKTLAQLLPSSCKILNLSHRKTSGTCQGLGHYISQWQTHNL